MQQPATEPSRSAEFTTFMRAYQDMVFSTAARLTGNDAQAEDIAQDAFVKAYENFSHLRSSPTAGGWLKTVTTNLALNYLTRYRKRWRLLSQFNAPTEDAQPELQFPQPDRLLADLDQEQRRGMIDQALKRLPELQRRAALPWWRRSFAHWPSAARAGFVLVCLALIGVVFLGGNWAAATIQSLHASGASSLSSGRQALAVMTAAAELATLFARAVPPAWIYAGLAAGAVLYAALFGLGAAAYRTLYLSPAKGR